DDEIAVLQVLELDRAGEPPEHFVLGAGFHLRLGDLRFQVLADARETLVEKALVGLDHDGGKARLRRDLRDAGAHEPAPDDADLLDGHARTTSVNRYGQRRAAVRLPAAAAEPRGGHLVGDTARRARPLADRPSHEAPPRPRRSR